MCVMLSLLWFFFQAEDGIRDLVRSRGLGDVYKRQVITRTPPRNSLARIVLPESRERAGEISADKAADSLSLIHI